MAFEFIFILFCLKRASLGIDSDRPVLPKQQKMLSFFSPAKK